MARTAPIAFFSANRTSGEEEDERHKAYIKGGKRWPPATPPGLVLGVASADPGAIDHLLGVNVRDDQTSPVPRAPRRARLRPDVPAAVGPGPLRHPRPCRVG